MKFYDIIAKQTYNDEIFVHKFVNLGCRTNTYIRLVKMQWQTLMSCFRRDVDEIYAFLGYYAALCPETSVNNYHTTPRNIPELRRSQQRETGRSYRLSGMWLITKPPWL
jgi:hypothetical protein